MIDDVRERDDTGNEEAEGEVDIDLLFVDVGMVSETHGKEDGIAGLFRSEAAVRD